LWSEDFTDAYFKTGLHEWLATGKVTHDTSHVRDLSRLKIPAEDNRIGREFAREFRPFQADQGLAFVRHARAIRPAPLPWEKWGNRRCPASSLQNASRCTPCRSRREPR
jgi:hypothetical protein